MPRQPSRLHRLRTASTWPVGIALTANAYMWRTTVLHRSEDTGHSLEGHRPPPLPATVSHEEIQGPEDGSGPFFHRLYRTRITGQDRTDAALFGELCADLSRAVPLTLARFHKVLGEKHSVQAGDEYVVRMPGPWDGPVRVVERQSTHFRLATLDGHLEAGQIEFRVQPADGDDLRFEIESWTRSGDRFADFMYHRLRLAKEIQAHMWISFLENVVTIARGRMAGGIEIRTHRVTNGRG
jgi:hypothetical protein